MLLFVAAAGMSAEDKLLKVAAMTKAKNASLDAVVAKVLHHEGSYLQKKGDAVYEYKLGPSKVRTYVGK